MLPYLLLLKKVKKTWKVFLTLKAASLTTPLYRAKLNTFYGIFRVLKI